MIRTIGTLRYVARSEYGSGTWRYGANEIRIECDEPGCAANCTPKGIEHNGPVVECVYLRSEDDSWSLGERDLCPAHAPAEDLVHVGAEEGAGEWVAPDDSRALCGTGDHWCDGICFGFGHHVAAVDR